MNVGAILLILAVLVVVSLYLYAPFLRRARGRVDDEHSEASVLMAERDRVITALQELDFDASLGKIPAEDYPAERSALLQKGADVLRHLDEVAPRIGASRRGDAESRLERAAAAGRADGAEAGSELSDDDLESLIAARRKERKEKAAGFCPRCGKPVLVSDRFCPACGKSLT
jgi:NADH pyrophosphatase NudC (nudix superfamily)